MLLRLAAVALVLGTLVLSPADSADLPGPWVDGAGHDHRDPAQHAFVANFERTSWDALQADFVHMAGAHALEVRGGHLFVAAYSDMYGARGGLYVFDVTTDPARPKLVGHAAALGPMGGDRSMDATIDGDFAVVGTESTPAAYTKTGIVNPTPSGLLLIDTRDKTDPRIVHYWPSAAVHSVVVHRIGGADYVFTTDLLDLPYSVYRIDRDPTPRLTGVGRLTIFHDASVLDDPVLGIPIVVAADGTSGTTDRLRIWDVSNPARPLKIVEWAVPEASSRYAHSAVAAWIDGKRVVVLSSEDGGNVAPRFWILDATGVSRSKSLAENTASIQILGSWTNPQGVLGGPGLRFSLHNPRLVDGILTFAHYHAGVVQLDISTAAKLAAPEILAYYVPHDDIGYRSLLDAPQLAIGTDAIHYPRVYDVAVHPTTKHVYAADIWTGIHTLART